jgi:hypothetical protein
MESVSPATWSPVGPIPTDAMSTLLTRALGARVAERRIRPSAGVSAIPAAESGSVHNAASRAVRARTGHLFQSVMFCRAVAEPVA